MKGSTVSYDSGSFYLAVTNIVITDNEIKFTPYIKVTDAFSKKHKGKIYWKQPNDKPKTITKENIKSKGNYFSTSKKYSNKDEAVTITAEIGGKKSSVTIEATSKPAVPTLTVEQTNDYHFEIKVSGNGKPTIPVTSVILERQTDAESASWEELETWTGTVYGSYNHEYTDQGVERGHRYFYRARTHNVNGYSNYQEKGWYYTLPPDISEVNHSRVDNNQNIVTWSKSGQELDRELITGYEVHRKASDGVFTRIAIVEPGTIEDGTVTYTDSTCKTDEWYQYAIKPVNVTGASTIMYPSDEGTEATYNTPARPVKVTATKNGDGTVKITLDNRAKTADVLQIEKYQNDTWTRFEDIDESEEVVTEYTDTSSTTGTDVIYRARNGRSDMASAERYSDWTESNILQSLSAPNTPTLIYPLDNSIIAKDQRTVTLKWIHNPTDGTAQTAAEIIVLADGRIHSTPTVTTDQSLSVDIRYISAGATITWMVRTKGEYTDYSPWSSSYSIKLYERPTLNITSPENGDVIENLPLTLGYSYSDDSGIISSLKLDIFNENEIVYSKDLDPGEGTSGTYSYELSDYLFENETSYILKLTALSDLGMQSTDEIGVRIEYVPVILRNQYYVNTESDPETGYVTVMITSGTIVEDEDPDPDVPQPEVVNSPVEHAYLYRVYDGKRTLIKEVAEYEQLIDKYAPLNSEYTYELLEIAQNGNIAITTQECEIQSDYWYIYYGVDNEKIARAIWNPSGNVSLSRPDKQQIRYSGREYPVSYDSGANEEAYSFTATITDRNELKAFIAMMKQGGNGIWKSCDGSVYHADFNFNYSADYTKLTQIWDAKLDVTRVEGEAL